MQKVKEFTPILVSRNDDEINRLQKQLHRRADLFNEFFNMAAEFLDGQELDHKQLAADRMLYLGTLIPRQFPKATLEFNLEAAGTEDAYNELKTLAAKCGSFGGLSIQAGKAKPTKTALQAIVDANEKYTQTERQNEVIEKAQKFADAFNELVAADIISEHTATNFLGRNQFLKWDGSKYGASLNGIRLHY